MCSDTDMMGSDLHIDNSLARGFARQFIRETIDGIARREAEFNSRTARLTSLPKKPAKRLKLLTDYFLRLFGDSVICVTRPPGKRVKEVSVLFLGFRDAYQSPGSPAVLEVLNIPLTPYLQTPGIKHTGVRISQHVLERIIQRNGARSLPEITNELRIPILLLMLTEIAPEETLWIPSPNGMVLCGSGGDQPFDGLLVKTFITFVHASQMTEQQHAEWREKVSRMDRDLVSAYPASAGGY